MVISYHNYLRQKMSLNEEFFYLVLSSFFLPSYELMFAKARLNADYLDRLG